MSPIERLRYSVVGCNNEYSSRQLLPTSEPMKTKRQRRTKMKWEPQAKIIDEALLKYYFVNISLLPRYIFI